MINRKRNSVMNCDFEQAAHSAINETFLDVQIKGCFFHLAQNMQKHLARMGFTSLYNTDPDFAIKAKMIIGIAFVPLNKIDKYLDAVTTELPPELGDLFNWFEDNLCWSLEQTRKWKNSIFSREH